MVAPKRAVLRGKVPVHQTLAGLGLVHEGGRWVSLASVHARLYLVGMHDGKCAGEGMNHNGTFFH